MKQRIGKVQVELLRQRQLWCVRTAEVGYEWDTWYFVRREDALAKYRKLCRYAYDYLYLIEMIAFA